MDVLDHNRLTMGRIRKRKLEFDPVHVYRDRPMTAGAARFSGSCVRQGIRCPGNDAERMGCQWGLSWLLVRQ